jgi:2Fe-2S ferredoxin
MSKVTFLPYNITIEAREGISVLDVALDNAIELPHNCGGVCACSTCHVVVKQGLGNLSAMGEDEADQLDEADGLTLNSRLACQAKVLGDVTVEIPLINPALRPLFHEAENLSMRKGSIDGIEMD